MRQSLEAKNSNTNLNFKRESKLTQKVAINVWLDYLNFELRSNDLLDVIDDKITQPPNLEKHDLEKRKSLVRDIIINHLDEYYHKISVNVKDPKEIINKTRGSAPLRVSLRLTRQPPRAPQHLLLTSHVAPPSLCNNFVFT